jgi:hypothetical protein
MYGTLDYESALHHVSVEQLKLVASRCKDKKVRKRLSPSHGSGG